MELSATPPASGPERIISAPTSTAGYAASIAKYTVMTWRRHARSSLSKKKRASVPGSAMNTSIRAIVASTSSSTPNSDGLRKCA